MSYRVIGSRKTRTFRVLWALEELGQDYDWVDAAPRGPEALALHPSGKVPLLQHYGSVLSDSVAIMTYLADRHGALTAPAGTLARARQDAVTLWLIDDVDAILWAAAKHSFALPPERRVAELKPVLKWEFQRAADTLAGHLGDGPFLTGEAITLTDILAAHCLAWARVARFPDPPAPLRDWLSDMQARPAYRRAQGPRPQTDARS